MTTKNWNKHLNQSIWSQKFILFMSFCAQEVRKTEMHIVKKLAALKSTSIYLHSHKTLHIYCIYSVDSVVAKITQLLQKMWHNKNMHRLTGLVSPLHEFSGLDIAVPPCEPLKDTPERISSIPLHSVCGWHKGASKKNLRWPTEMFILIKTWE